MTQQLRLQLNGLLDKRGQLVLALLNAGNPLTPIEEATIRNQLEACDDEIADVLRRDDESSCDMTDNYPYAPEPWSW